MTTPVHPEVSSRMMAAEANAAAAEAELARTRNSVAFAELQR